MIVSHVSLKNWRNFRTADIELGNRAFLVSTNASGKSNFLDVFRFLRDITSCFESVRYLHIVTQAVINPEGFVGTLKNTGTLFELLITRQVPVEP